MGPKRKPDVIVIDDPEEPPRLRPRTVARPDEKSGQPMYVGLEEWCCSNPLTSTCIRADRPRQQSSSSSAAAAAMIRGAEQKVKCFRPDRYSTRAICEQACYLPGIRSGEIYTPVLAFLTPAERKALGSASSASGRRAQRSGNIAVTDADVLIDAMENKNTDRVLAMIQQGRGREAAYSLLPYVLDRFDYKVFDALIKNKWISRRSVQFYHVAWEIIYTNLDQIMWDMVSRPDRVAQRLDKIDKILDSMLGPMSVESFWNIYQSTPGGRWPLRMASPAQAQQILKVFLNNIQNPESVRCTVSMVYLLETKQYKEAYDVLRQCINRWTTEDKHLLDALVSQALTDEFAQLQVRIRVIPEIHRTLQNTYKNPMKSRLETLKLLTRTNVRNVAAVQDVINKSLDDRAAIIAMLHILRS